jgi:hypothetical protein
MVSVLISSVADPVFRPHLINSKTIKLVFSAKHAVLRSNSIVWLARNQDNVYELSKLLFQ